MSLYKVNGSRTLTNETLSTFTCEKEFDVNSRPLTNTSSNINDPLPLTQNRFLLSRLTVNFPPGVFSEKKITISKSWRTSQQLAKHFWNKFLIEYLPNQQKVCKWTKGCPNLKRDETILFEFWRISRLEVFGHWPKS